MSSTVDGHTDHTAFDQPGYDGPPPPHYTEKGGSPVHRADLKVTNDADYKHGPWLLKRTSIHVESTPSNVLEDNFSDHASISTTRSGEKRAARNLLFKFGRQQATEQHRDDRISIAESNETSIFGTTVSIQAGQARKISSKQREMKGLEQAASVKKWASNGKPAEAWGKLIKVSRNCIEVYDRF